MATPQNLIINDSPEEFLPTNISIIELIAATVDAVTSTEVTVRYPNEISALIRNFSGKQDEDVANWFERIEQKKNVYRVPEEAIMLMITNKLEGFAILK
ncbi:hypothetical protein QE152_g37953 [Popillia japonica]|uniref:Uncharacterized protein n=1 Tax=Popillia japonica TaxID=7064 RepID=A0AAW1I8Q9_POPJA